MVGSARLREKKSSWMQKSAAATGRNGSVRRAVESVVGTVRPFHPPAGRT